MTPRLSVPPSQLFPLPQETPETCLHTFEGFTGDQLDFIAGSNQRLSETTDPVVHLLAYKEDPVLALAQERGWLEPATANGIFYAAQRYRAGVCIGATIVRTRIGECALPLPALQVDPGRRYLSFPEEKTGDNFMRYYSEMLAGHLDAAYLQPAVKRRYFAGQQSVADVYALERAWVANGMDFLLRGQLSADEMFGEVCRGMFHTFRLYRMLEREAYLAPWDETAYQPQRHQILRPAIGANAPRPGEYHTYRRWLGGVVAKGPRDGFLNRRLTFDYWGDTILVPGTKVRQVRRCLTGYVHGSQAPADGMLHVAFRNSMEQYKVRPDDTLVVRRGDDGSYYTMFGAATVPDPGELVALCHNSEAIMVSDLRSAPMDERLMRALTRQLAA